MQKVLFGLYFHVFGLNTRIYFVPEKLRIWLDIIQVVV